MNQKNKTIIVLGPPRSGTSLVSSILQILGVNMGRVGPSVKSNPKGDWEDIDFMELNKEIISAAQEKFGREKIPSAEEIITLEKKFAEKIKKLIKEKSKKEGYWGWKDPHTSLTIELYLPYIENPHIVSVSRSIYDTTASYRKLVGGIDSSATNYIKAYFQRNTNFLKSNPALKTLYLSFEKLISSPIDESKKIADFLGIEYDAEKKKRIEEFVIPRDRIETEKKRARFRRKIFVHIPRAIKNKIWRLLK